MKWHCLKGVSRHKNKIKCATWITALLIVKLLVPFRTTVFERRGEGK
jgi:hypothetical protein